MHPRACVSAISTFGLALDEDLAFWAAHDIDTVGVSVAKLERFGWVEGTRLVADACIYFASKESGFVTGVNLQLDGGSSIARARTLG